MKRKNYLKSMLCTAAVLFLLAACTGTTPLESNGENNVPAPTVSQSEDATRLKVMTYNVKNCESGKNIEGIAADIQKEAPDVVCVQELDQNADRSGGKDVLKLLAEQVHMNYRFYPAMKFQGGYYGIGILSVYPLEECRITPLKTRAKDEARVLAQAVITVNGKKLNLFNTHLSYEDAQSRFAQLTFLQEQLSVQQPFVLMGDFNVESMEEYSRFKEVQLINRSETAYESYLGEGFRCLDNIIVSQGVAVLFQKMGHTTVSDHRPLVAELELK